MQIETKLNLNDAVYLVSKIEGEHLVILSAKIHHIEINFYGETIYYYNQIKIEVDKDNYFKGESFSNGDFSENLLDNFSLFNFRNIMLNKNSWKQVYSFNYFSKKKKVNEYLRKLRGETKLQLNTKLDIDNKIYFIFGDPKIAIIIFSATVNEISYYKKKSGEEVISYSYNNIQIEVNKSGKSTFEKNKIVLSGYVDEYYIDNFEETYFPKFGMSNCPTFTSKSNCKKYLKKLGAI